MTKTLSTSARQIARRAKRAAQKGFTEFDNPDLAKAAGLKKVTSRNYDLPGTQAWPPPKKPHLIKVGDIVSIEKFSYVNVHGGTSESNNPNHALATGPFTIKVVKKWHDYETGWRYWGIPTTKQLEEFLQVNAHSKEYAGTLFFSQWELS